MQYVGSIKIIPYTFISLVVSLLLTPNLRLSIDLGFLIFCIIFISPSLLLLFGNRISYKEDAIRVDSFYRVIYVDRIDFKAKKFIGRYHLIKIKSKWYLFRMTAESKVFFDSWYIC